MADLASKAPAACGSTATEHRSVHCRTCQRIYAQRKRSAARGGLTRRRRYRRKNHAGTEVQRVEQVAPTRPRRRTCGSLAVDHVARRCAACRKKWNRAYYLALCAKRRALGAVRTIAGEVQGAAPARCFECGALGGAVVREESDFGTFELSACAAHAVRAQKVLADRVAEHFVSENYAPTRTIADSYAEALDLARSLPQDVLDRIRHLAGIALGMRIAEDSPLYRSQFAKLVRQAAAQLSGR